MRYYDDIFRNTLLELLSNYRKMLNQASISSKDENYTILIADTIKKLDEAVKIIKPSMFDALTEKKVEKLQESQFRKAKKEEIEKAAIEKMRQKIMEECRKNLTDEIRAELTPKIKAELQQEREEKKKRKKAKKNEENLKLMQTQLFHSLQTAFSMNPENAPTANTPSTDNLADSEKSETTVSLKKETAENAEMYDDMSDDSFGNDEPPESL